MVGNKRGWIRIVEASIGILLVAGVLLAVYSRGVRTEDLSEQIYELQILALDEIANDNDLRREILNGVETRENMREFIVNKNYFPANFGFCVNVCDVGEVCGVNNAVCNNGEAPFDRNIYAEERIISADLTKYFPKKIRLFVWER